MTILMACILIDLLSDDTDALALRDDLRKALADRPDRYRPLYDRVYPVSDAEASFFRKLVGGEDGE